MKLLVLSILISVFSFSSLYPNNFDTTVVINGQERMISYIAPNLLNYTNPYDLIICLHDSSETAVEYKNRVINELHWDTLFPHSIIAFPDAGITKNFYNPLDNYAIIDSSISVVSSLYEFKDYVDFKIIGHNSSARFAAKYAYDNSVKIRGAILLNPILNGINDVRNIPPSSIVYNYNATKNVRTFIVRDTNRSIYSEMFERKVAEGSGIEYSNKIANFDSKHPADSLLKNAIFFIEHPAFVEGDFGIYDIDIPKRICNIYTTHSILVKHYRGPGGIGKNPVIIVDDGFKFYFSNFTGTGNFTTSNVHYNFLREYYKFDSTFNGKVKIKTYIGSKNDVVRSNDTMVKYIYYQPEPLESYFETSFEVSDTLYDKYWYLSSSGDKTTWQFNTEYSTNGERSLSMHNNNLGYDNHSQSEEIFLPYIDLSSLSYRNIQFDYAFNYQIYGNEIKTDTLKVYVSADCDNTFELIYEKSGANLATVAQPISDPSNLSEAIFRPKESDWRTETIDLEKYKDKKNVSIKIAIVSGNGGTVYIDNVRIGDFLNSVERKPNNEFAFSPNPATNYIRITESYNQNNMYYIADITGRIVLVVENFGQPISLENLPKGFYFIYNNFIKPQKLLIK